jgi:hypothetical protein
VDSFSRWAPKLKKIRGIAVRIRGEITASIDTPGHGGWRSLQGVNLEHLFRIGSFVGRMLMLRERLTYEQWSCFDRTADLICNGILARMPVDHPESAIWDNRRKGD